MEELLKQVSELAAKNLHRNILSCFRQKAAPKKPAMLTGAPPIPPPFFQDAGIGSQSICLGLGLGLCQAIIGSTPGLALKIYRKKTSRMVLVAVFFGS